mmetsp:Transcript_10458/g.15664  ORF Transcript_10458/g.15664 Transcript_10458/m.15664 type:complete len:497 (-) Transcript_10458:200-1690(-)
MSTEDAKARAQAIAAKLTADLNLKSSNNYGMQNNYDAVKKKIKIPIPEHLFRETNILGMLIGPKGSTLRSLNERTGAKVVVLGKGSNMNNEDTDPNEPLHVSVEGTDEAIEIASREIHLILHNPDEANKLKQKQMADLENMRNQMGQGMGGGSMSNQSPYGPASSMSTGQYNPNSSQSFGQQNQAQQSQFSSGGSSYGPAEFKLTMAIPNDKVGLVIGKLGATIKGIQSRTQCNIQIPQHADVEDTTRRTITLSASTNQQVEIASREIQNVIDAGITGIGIIGGNSVSLDVPNDRVGLIIGKGGVTIKDIQNRCGVRVQIPTQPDPITNLRLITIVGPGDGPIRAKYEVEQLLSGAAHASSSYGQSQQSGGYGMTPYGQAAAYAQSAYAMAAGYPAYDQRYQQPGLSDPYAHQFQQQGAMQMAQQSNAAPTPAGQVDLTQYYSQFWQYAAYYGEAIAREQYGAWAPPPGTPPPPGIVLPSEQQQQQQQQQQASQQM